MIDFVTTFIGFSYTNQEGKFTNNLCYISANRPIKMHFFVINAVYSDILCFVRSSIGVISKIIYIDRHLRHINTVPVSRTIERYCLYIMIVLDGKTFELVGDGDYPFVIDYYVSFVKTICELPC